MLKAVRIFNTEGSKKWHLNGCTFALQNHEPDSMNRVLTRKLITLNFALKK